MRVQPSDDTQFLSAHWNRAMSSAMPRDQADDAELRRAM